MFIIPYIHKKTQINNMFVTCISIFTVGGTQIWEEDDSFTLNDVLIINDIFVYEPPQLKGNTYFCNVDSNKTNMSDFYKWEEITPGMETFCWRTFYLFGKDSYTSWLPLPTRNIGQYTYQELFDLICV